MFILQLVSSAHLLPQKNKQAHNCTAFKENTFSFLSLKTLLQLSHLLSGPWLVQCCKFLLLWMQVCVCTCFDLYRLPLNFICAACGNVRGIASRASRASLWIFIHWPIFPSSSPGSHCGRASKKKQTQKLQMNCDFQLKLETWSSKPYEMNSSWSQKGRTRLKKSTTALLERWTTIAHM